MRVARCKPSHTSSISWWRPENSRGRRYCVIVATHAHSLSFFITFSLFVCSTHTHTKQRDRHDHLRRNLLSTTRIPHTYVRNPLRNARFTRNSHTMVRPEEQHHYYPRGGVGLLMEVSRHRFTYVCVHYVDYKKWT